MTMSHVVVVLVLAMVGGSSGCKDKDKAPAEPAQGSGTATTQPSPPDAAEVAPEDRAAADLVREWQTFADKMCACADKACVTALTEEGDQLKAKFMNTAVRPPYNEQIERAGKRIAGCAR